MAKTNRTKKSEKIYTHGGGRAVKAPSALAQLRRSVLCCLLWEDEFYENGESITNRIKEVAEKVAPEDLAALAIEARIQHNLRHVPLLLLTVLVKTGAGRVGLVANTIESVISRADEVPEFVALYQRMNGAKEGVKKAPLTAQMKKGLARAIGKFDEYQLAKYNRDTAWKLRDVLFLVHAKPKNEEQTELFKKLANNDLKVPDTWEVSLSTGKDKKETFTRLLQEDKLGYMALLRNLRNMEDAGVDRDLIKSAILARKGAYRVLPFRFISAAKAAPALEDTIDQAMLEHLAQLPKLEGKTLIIIDVSGSMYTMYGMSRALIACALGAIAREVCETAYIYATAGNDWTREHKTQLVPARRGMALVDAIYGMCHPLGGGGIFLNQVMRYCQKQHKGETIDRVIVITDEQDCSRDNDDAPSKAPLLGHVGNYMINVASYENGISYKNWTHIDGFSESVLRYILATEQELSQETA